MSFRRLPSHLCPSSINLIPKNIPTINSSLKGKTEYSCDVHVSRERPQIITRLSLFQQKQALVPKSSLALRSNSLRSRWFLSDIEQWWQGTHKPHSTTVYAFSLMINFDQLCCFNLRLWLLGEHELLSSFTFHVADLFKCFFNSNFL